MKISELKPEQEVQETTKADAEIEKAAKLYAESLSDYPDNIDWENYLRIKAAYIHGRLDAEQKPDLSDRWNEIKSINTHGRQYTGLLGRIAMLEELKEKGIITLNHIKE